MAKLTFFIKRNPVTNSEFKYAILAEDENARIYLINGVTNYKIAKNTYNELLARPGIFAFNPASNSTKDFSLTVFLQEDFDLSIFALRKKRPDKIQCAKCNVKHFTKYPHLCRKPIPKRKATAFEIGREEDV